MFDEKYGDKPRELYQEVQQDLQGTKAAIAAIAAYLARTDLTGSERSEAQQKLDELKRRFNL
jgi:heterodisulfide reductase subunit B